jgi:hypothetical protein
MVSARKILALTFVGSFAVISIERGVYFYTASRLGFGDGANLALALAFGLMYVIGSLVSHRVTVALGEKRTLGCVVVAQMLVHLGMSTLPGGVMFWILDPLAGLLYGMQWPIIESYISAGRCSRDTHRILGLFNMSWAVAIPLNLALAGPIIEHAPAGLFLLPAALNLIMLLLMRHLPSAPPRLQEDHPHRPALAELARLRALLGGHRWGLVLSMTALFILAPIMPRIYRDLGMGVESASALSGLLDVLRVGAFLLLWLYGGWHGKTWPVLGTVVLLPVGFAMVLLGGRIEWVLLGEVLFGLGNGLAYYGALHYAQVVHNAAVEAGGAHEALIGTGFAVGPLAGLIGLALAPRVGQTWPELSETWTSLLGTLCAFGPVLLLCLVAAVRCLLRARAGYTSAS